VTSKAFAAVSAVLSENLQQATSALPQKSSLAANRVPQKQRRALLFFPVFRCFDTHRNRLVFC